MPLLALVYAERANGLPVIGLIAPAGGFQPVFGRGGRDGPTWLGWYPPSSIFLNGCDLPMLDGPFSPDLGPDHVKVYAVPSDGAPSSSG